MATGTLGVDYTGDRWLAGMALSHSHGEGAFSRGEPDGDIASSLTALYPYLRYSVNERASVWGAVGYGWGRLSSDSGDRTETGLGMFAGAIGGRAELVAPEGGDGFALTAKADALLVQMNARSAPDLAATDADVRRLRLSLEGSYDTVFDDGLWLAPFLEAVVRHDAGDAEEGAGVEIGGGVRLSHPRRGLTMELDAHVLLAHEAPDHRLWGASAALRYDPEPTSSSGLSLSLSLASGAGRSLWMRETMAGIADDRPPGARLEAELGYRLSALRPQGVGMPYAGLSLSSGGRDWRVGYLFEPAPSLAMELRGTLRESVGSNDPAEYLVAFWATAHW